MVEKMRESQLDNHGKKGSSREEPTHKKVEPEEIYEEDKFEVVEEVGAQSQAPPAKIHDLPAEKIEVLEEDIPEEPKQKHEEVKHAN